MTTPNEAPGPPERPETVTVSPPGEPYESLWAIAERLFEDGSRWEKIYDSNRDVIDDPHHLRPGTTLRLPMEIYPSHLRSVAGVFEREREELDRFVKEAAADLNAIGNFWGDGEEGTRFFKGEGGGTGYEAVSGQIIEGTEILLDAHSGIPKRLRLMADRVQVADWDSVSAVLAALPAPDDEHPAWGA